MTILKSIDMKNKQYLTFSWHDLQYGIETSLVQETFPLPELTPIAEVSTEIIGILNLRGQIIPIIYLDLLHQEQTKTCKVSDCVIVLQWNSLLIGLVVHQVHELLELHTEVIETQLCHELINESNAQLITGIAKVDERDILLLNPQQLIPQMDAVLGLIWDAQMQIDTMPISATRDGDKPGVERIMLKDSLKEREKSYSPVFAGEVREKSYSSVFTGEEREKSHTALLPSHSSLKETRTEDETLYLLEGQRERSIASFYDLYCPNTTPKERSIFQQRADNFRQPIASFHATNQMISLAVIGLNNEYFGLELEQVRTFIGISNLTSIPGCPNHIAGNMNLQGKIITLVDIREVLNLPTTPINVGDQAVVVQVEDIVVGLPVEQVFEMIDFNLTDIMPLPLAPSNFGDQYIRGTAFFQGKILQVLDLSKILTEGGLAVDETI